MDTKEINWAGAFNRFNTPPDAIIASYDDEQMNTKELETLEYEPTAGPEPINTECMDTKDLIYNTPRTIIEEKSGDFVFNLNDIKELRITNKYEPTIFVIDNEALAVLLRVAQYKPQGSISPIFGIMGGRQDQ